MCFCVCKESNILVQRSTDPKRTFVARQGKTAVPDDASNYWKMLIVQDGSAHSARALSSTPTANWPRAPGASAPRLTRSLHVGHHLWNQDPLFLAKSIKAAWAAKSRFSQAGPRAVTSPSLSKLATMNLEVICDVQEVASTINASAMTK